MKKPTIGILLAVLCLNCLVQPAAAQPDSAHQASVPSIRDLKHPSPEDKQLIKSVRRTLARSGGFNPSNISVLAHDGVVVLSGTVPSQKDLDEATTAASHVPNVTSVVNRLTIRAPM